MSEEPRDRPANPLFLAAHWLGVGRPEKSLEALALPGGHVVEDPRARWVRAAALLELARDVEATAEAEAGLALDPEHVGLLDLLATARWRRGDTAGAERAFLDALKLDSEDPVLLARYALLVAHEGQLEKAARLLREAERIEPEDVTVHYVAAVLAYLRGDDSDAARRGRKILAEDPELVSAHAFLGRLDFERGRTRRGGEHLVRAASLDPASVDNVEAARHARFINHPLLRPAALVARFGPAKVWIAAIVVIFGLRAAGFETAAAIAALVYLTFAVYTWVAPPLVRRWVRRRI